LQIDPYLRIGDDLQLYVRLQSDLGSYGSESDQEVARSILSDWGAKVGLQDQPVLDVIASALFNFTKVSFVCDWCDLPCSYCYLILLKTNLMHCFFFFSSWNCTTTLPDGQRCIDKGTLRDVYT
jgi:hypothetical protein